jgi:hypothetical protein
VHWAAAIVPNRARPSKLRTIETLPPGKPFDNDAAEISIGSNPKCVGDK